MQFRRAIVLQTLRNSRPRCALFFGANKRVSAGELSLPRPRSGMVNKRCISSKSAPQLCKSE